MITQLWSVRVEGLEVKHGTMEWPYDETFEVQADCAAEALYFVSHGRRNLDGSLSSEGPEWGLIDDSKGITITIEPVEEEDAHG